jgi:hypothetical protein
MPKRKCPKCHGDIVRPSGWCWRCYRWVLDCLHHEVRHRKPCPS